MNDLTLNIKLNEWIDRLLSHGKNAFSLEQFVETHPAYSETAIKRSLNRLSKKGRIVPIFKGYYLIISPEHLATGIIPPSLFMDEFMKYLDRPYYVGLLSAAALYGAAHQHPQEYFVITNFPTLRPTERKGIKINYISIKNIPVNLLESQKTASGYLNVSSPELTALDLIRYERRIGGLNRAATVLQELTGELRSEKFTMDLFESVTVTSIQRLGFILTELGQTILADQLFDACKRAGLAFYRIPLVQFGSINGFRMDPKWKVIINTKLEIDL